MSARRGRPRKSPDDIREPQRLWLSANEMRRVRTVARQELLDAGVPLPRTRGALVAAWVRLRAGLPPDVARRDQHRFGVDR